MKKEKAKYSPWTYRDYLLNGSGPQGLWTATFRPPTFRPLGLGLPTFRPLGLGLPTLRPPGVGLPDLGSSGPCQPVCGFLDRYPSGLFP
jgi:hypothetical protein